MTVQNHETDLEIWKITSGWKHEKRLIIKGCP
jgi:hypothetical protein